MKLMEAKGLHKTFCDNPPNGSFGFLRDRGNGIKPRTKGGVRQFPRRGAWMHREPPLWRVSADQPAHFAPRLPARANPEIPAENFRHLVSGRCPRAERRSLCGAELTFGFLADGRYLVKQPSCVQAPSRGTRLHHAGRRLVSILRQSGYAPMVQNENVSGYEREDREIKRKTHADITGEHYT